MWTGLTIISPRFIIMAANSGALGAAQVFRTEDAPLYHVAFTATLSIAAICMALLVVQLTWYFISNKKIDRENEGSTVEPRLENGVLVKTWKWSW